MTRETESEEMSRARWSDKVNWGDIPERMREPIIRYVEEGERPGSFLRAILTNDLIGAALKADQENVRLLPTYAKLLVMHAPAASFGSGQDFASWVKRGGIKGGYEGGYDGL